MKIIKKLIAVLAIAVMSLSVVGCGKVDENVIATVDGTPIYKDAFDLEMEYVDYMMMYQYGEDYSDNAEAMEYYESQKEAVLQYLIESQILLEKAKDFKIEPTDEEIETELENTKASFETEEAFNEALAQSDLTLDELKENIKQNLQITKVIEEATKDVAVTDQEIEDYYNKNIANYTTGAGANMSHILVATEQEAKDIKAKYDAGESFEDLAKQYGTDGTKDLGGELGFIEYDSQSYDKDFLAGAKTLKEGEVSDPVKTQFGWHLIKVTGIQNEDVVQPLDEVKDQIKATLEEEKQYEAFDTKLNEWKDEMTIKTYEDHLVSEEPAETTEATEATDAVDAIQSDATTEGADSAQATEGAQANDAAQTTDGAQEETVTN